MNDRLGRNPFGKTKSKAVKAPTPDTPRKRASRKKAPPKRALILGWKLDRFAFLRFDREPKRSRLALISLRLHNAAWKNPGQYEVGSILGFSLLSVRVG